MTESVVIHSSREGWEVGPWLAEPDEVCQVWGKWVVKVARFKGKLYKKLSVEAHCFRPEVSTFPQSCFGSGIPAGVKWEFTYTDGESGSLVFCFFANNPLSDHYMTIDQTLHQGLEIVRSLDQFINREIEAAGGA